MNSEATFPRDEHGNMIPPPPTATEEAARRDARITDARTALETGPSPLDLTDVMERIYRLRAAAAESGEVKTSDELEAERDAQHRALKARRDFEDDLAVAGLGHELGAWPIGNLQTPAARAVVATFLDSTTAGSRGKLILHGATGSGKTVAAIDLGKRLIEAGMRVRFVIHPQYVQARYVDAARPRGASRDAYRNQYANAQVLIVDDLARGYAIGATTSHVATETIELIDARCEAGKVTIVTTNHSTPALAAMFGDTLVSRLGAGAMVAKFENGDLRRPAVW